MNFEEQSKQNNPEEQEKNIITGKELEGKNMIGVGTVDLDIYEDYFKSKGIECKIYTYKDDPELSLLVLDTPDLSSKQIFDELIKDNEKIEGAFWPDSTVKEETELELVYGDNKN